MVCPSTPAAPWLAFTCLYASTHLALGNTKRLCFVRGLLPLPVGPFLKLDGAAPLLSFHYGPSSLLRAAPPRCPASVLSSLWVLHLDFSLSIGATGSHVPHGSLKQVHAAFMPDAARAVSRFSPGLIPGQRLAPGFDIVPTLSTRHQRFTHVRLPVPYLTRSRLAFSPSAHHRLFTAAAWGGLEPAPAGRLRGAFPHLPCGFRGAQSSAYLTSRAIFMAASRVLR